MINEEKLAKVKKKMARKRAKYAIKSVFLNPKNILIWIYWILILAILPAANHFLIGNDILVSFGSSIAGPILAFISIFFVEYKFKKEEIDIEEKYGRDW